MIAQESSSSLSDELLAKSKLACEEKALKSGEDGLLEPESVIDVFYLLSRFGSIMKRECEKEAFDV